MFIFVLYEISERVLTHTSSSIDSIYVIDSTSSDTLFLSEVNSINLGLFSSVLNLILFSSTFSREIKPMASNQIKNGLKMISALSFRI